MTPQEKAEDLVMKHSFETHFHNAKNSALTTVDEIVEALHKNGDDYWSSEYWEQVKEEIENIQSN